jgi:hypothetical protein|tara:strand:- start:262 stop:1044 length:783 start_codon:yes stop_codon:yes gene_type:complete
MLPTFLKPYHLENYHLLRIGPKLDGGYVVDKRSIQKTNTIITCGLNDDWEFEKNFLKNNKNCKVIAFDHTIDREFWVKRFKKDIRHFFLLKKIRLRKIIGIFKYLDYTKFFKNDNKHHIIKIGSQNIDHKEITISKILENHNNVILKIDIEGDEYKILNDIIDNSKKINSLIIEFHNIHQYMLLIKKFIENNKTLKLIHIHGNNFAGKNSAGDPNVLELTFINIEKTKMELVKTQKNYPLKNLDYKNTHRKDDFILKFND